MERLPASAAALPSIIASFAAEENKAVGLKEKTVKEVNEKKCKRLRRSREGFLGDFWRPVDVWVTAGAAGREGYQPGSSDAGPHASDVKGEQE